MSTDELMNLSVKNWLDLQKKQSLIRKPYDDPVGSNGFDQTVEMILKAINNISDNEELKQIPLDESCLRAVFHLSFAFLSIYHVFSAIQLYRDLKAEVSLMILLLKESPNEEKKKDVIAKVQSYKRVLEMSNCSTEKLVQVFDDILENLSPEKFDKILTAHLHVDVDEDEESKSEKRKVSFDQGSDCLKKKRKVSDDVSGDEGTSSVASHQVSGKEGTSAACPQAADPSSSCKIFAEETNVHMEDREVGFIMDYMVSRGTPFIHQMKESLVALEDASNNYIATTLFSVKQMLSDLSQHLNLPASHHKVDYQPSHKLKLILLILKEMMSYIREHPYASSFGFTLPKYVELTPINEDADKYAISYGPGHDYSGNLDKYGGTELYSRLFLSKSMQAMVRLDDLMKAEFLSFREAYKARGGPFLDAESHDMLIYLVACVKQMKKDLKKKLQQLAQDREKPGALYEDSSVQRKLREFECQMVSDLVSDFDFCREQCTILDQEMVRAFSLLVDEFQLGSEDDQM